MFVFLFM